MKFLSSVVLAATVSVGSLSPVMAQFDRYAQIIARSVAPSKSLKKTIVAAAREMLFDPYSIRDAEISNVADFGNGTQGVCVRLNSKNRMGGYTGRQSYGITLSGEVLVTYQLNHPLCARPDVKWRKFTELEALRNL